MRHDCRCSSGPGFSTGKKRSWWLHPEPLCAGIAGVSSCTGAGRHAADSQHFPRTYGQLIARIVRENITWGEERVADELSLKLGILVSPRTVRKYWPLQPDCTRQRRTPSQRWTTFVKNHARGIVACDFLVAVTVRFQVLFVFLVMEVGSRRILHYNVTALLQQIGRCSSSGTPFPVTIVISS